MLSYTRQIADFASNLRLADIPDEVRARAKRVILDGLACALYGSDVRWTEILAGVVKRLDPNGGQATLWGRNETASAVNAALVNGTMVQGYELDDGGEIHICATVLPAAFAAAEYVGADKVDGERLLLAIIAGFEIGPRVGTCMLGAELTKNGWHAPAVISSFPAAIAAGVVLGLNSDQVFHAMGIGGAQAVGLMAAQYGSMLKRMQCAKSSQTGLYGALLAADGFTGIENIFEESYGGFCSTFARSVDKVNFPALVDGFGERWETMRIAIKIYACIGSAHTAIVAIDELMKETGLKAEAVKEITIGVTESVRRHCGWSPYVPNGLTAAQMHIGFCVAMQLIEGEVFVDQMIEENVGRPDLVALANRVTLVRNIEREQKEHDYSKGADVEVKLTNGQVLRKTADFRPGRARQPLRDEQIDTKFRRLASKVLTEERVAELERIVWDLDRAPTLRPLINVLRGNDRAIA